MSQLINVADDVYEELTKLKQARKTSYSEVIREAIFSTREKKGSWEHTFAFIKQLEKEFKGPKEKIDIDKIVYGVSRESS